MSRALSFLVVGVVGVVLLAAAESRAADERAIVFSFTPTERAQIAIWIESADGTFLSTVGLTQAVSVRGIGNRPGATQMNSGYHWPYGRREGVLPIWAHRRMSAPGATGFPRVTFQHRPEGYASRTCEDSTKDSYFCLSFTAETTRKETLDAVTCASVFNSDKGAIGSSATEPVMVGGPPAWHASTRTLSPMSPYPPRRDFASCAEAGSANVCNGGYSTCNDSFTSADYADQARMVMPDIDAVTMATPPAEVAQTVMFSVPASWPDGEYAAYLEVNTEGDYNGTYSVDNYPAPCSKPGMCASTSDWDSWALSYGYSYRGQPSVVYGVPFTLGPAASYTALNPVGYGSVDGTDDDPGGMRPMDGSISNDPQNAPGSGADRLRLASTSSSRVGVEVRPCLENDAPNAPTDLSVEPVVDPKHSHEWGHLHFNAPTNSAAGIARYEVRVSTDPNPILPGDATSFIRGLPAQAASSKTEGLMVPINGAPGAPVDADFGGMVALTHYWIGVRAVDNCNRAGPHVVAEMETTRINFTQLPPVDPFKGQCFIATAAWGSAMAPSVMAMRHARDRLLSVPVFALASDLYGRSGPAAASVLKRSDTARVLARQLLAPLGTTAEAVTPAR
jgi:hypothetical protein